jgi:hypothetical protein
MQVSKEPFMTLAQLKSRVDALEKELLQLKNNRQPPAKNKEWLEQIWGTFADDPLFDEAMKLGRQWRHSQQPKSRNRRQPRSGKRA